MWITSDRPPSTPRTWIVAGAASDPRRPGEGRGLVVERGDEAKVARGTIGLGRHLLPQGPAGEDMEDLPMGFHRDHAGPRFAAQSARTV